MKMVDVADKERTSRVAVATGRVRMEPSTVERVRQGRVEKGDVLAAARLAGVMAVKRTPDLIPLCHPISIGGATVDVELGDAELRVRAEVRAVDRTGVEMEALTAVMAAALTAYDMLKSVDRAMVVDEVRLEHKSGGRSGTWNRSGTSP